jgi:hypothetical protein
MHKDHRQIESTLDDLKEVRSLIQGAHEALRLAADPVDDECTLIRDVITRLDRMSDQVERIEQTCSARFLITAGC